MSARKDKFFQMRVDAEFLAQLDDARRNEDDLPGRTEMVRRLLEWALIARPVHRMAKQRKGEAA